MDLEGCQSLPPLLRREPRPAEGAVLVAKPPAIWRPPGSRMEGVDGPAGPQIAAALR